MPDARLEKTRRSYSPESTVDWVDGPAYYGPCPKRCGRLVPHAVAGISVDPEPCRRCQAIARQMPVQIDQYDTLLDRVLQKRSRK